MIYPLKNPDKTLLSEFEAETGLLLSSFLFGMKKNFLMSKSNSDDVLVVSWSVGAGVDESRTLLAADAAAGVAAVVVVKKNASVSGWDEGGGLGALSCKRDFSD